ncbi:Protein kinase APK1A, chloroplastic [Hordeum vulgare]|nr:Protein kinase APK1A, chloroplastic [Hordeum vulgare]
MEMPPMTLPVGTSARTRPASSTRRSTRRRWTCGCVPVLPPPTGAERRAEIARIRSVLPENLHNLPRYRRHTDQLAATKGVKPCGQHIRGRRQWWGVPGRTLEAVLEHIEDGNTPRYEYPAPSSFSRHRDSSWTPRRMESTTSSFSVSRSRSSESPALLPVKPESQETPLGGACSTRG